MCTPITKLRAALFIEEEKLYILFESELAPGNLSFKQLCRDKIGQKKMSYEKRLD